MRSAGATQASSPCKNTISTCPIPLTKPGCTSTPTAAWSIHTDIIEPFGYSEEDIYISAWRNGGKYQGFYAGASVTYRLGSLGNIYASGYHLYTAVSRTRYTMPDNAFAQLNYNFTPNFYISVAVRSFTGALQQEKNRAYR